MSVESVVICGIRRGGEVIGSDEFRQYSGRAGRKSGIPARVTVVCPESDECEAYSIVESPPPVVRSRMSGIAEVSETVLPCVGTAVHDEETFMAWQSRSLFHFQNGTSPVTWEEVSEFLRNCGCLGEDCERTPLGETSVRMLVSPKIVRMISERCIEVPEGIGTPRLDPVRLSYLVAPLCKGFRISESDGELLWTYERLCGKSGIPFGDFGEEAFVAWMAFPETRKDLSEEMTGISSELRMAIGETRKDLPRMLAVAESVLSCVNRPHLSDETRVWSCAVENSTDFTTAAAMLEKGLSKSEAIKFLHPEEDTPSHDDDY